MAGLSLPIGYSTYDPVRVEMLWKLLQSRVGFDVSRIEADTHYPETMTASWAIC